MKKPTLDGAISLSPSKHWDTEGSNSIQPAERLPFRCLAAYRVPTLRLRCSKELRCCSAAVPVVAVIVGGANTPIEQKEGEGACTLE